MNYNATLLYVEDDATSRDVMQIMLTNVMGFTDVTILPNSAGFMDCMDGMAVLPDLILLDIHMEPHDGFALLEMLRARPEYREVKVVAVTASVMNEEIELLKRSGFDGGIAKPIRFQVFPDLIKRLLAGEKVWFVA